MTKHMQVLLPALCRAAGDPDIAAIVHECCGIIGCFVSPERVLEIVTPRCAFPGERCTQVKCPLLLS